MHLPLVSENIKMIFSFYRVPINEFNIVMNEFLKMEDY